MSPSLQTMGFFMSDINFCNTKEQLNHLGEVVTGKVDGSPTGADIDTSTLPYTGQVRKTLPALEVEYEQSITNKEIEADAAIDSYRLLNKGPYSSGITLESKFEYITYNGESYFATNPPYTTTTTTPDTDGNLFLGGYTTFENVANKIGNKNELSNSNFLTPSPDAITHPNATPESYAAGTQIFSGVYAGDGGCTVTFIDGRVNCAAGDYKFKLPNINGLDRVPVFTSSVSDYDGTPKTTGVSHALVSDEYLVTVTPAAGDVFSVKLEQGSVATRHEVQIKQVLIATPEMYGAAGDGGSDDTEAVKKAFLSGLAVDLSGGPYYVTETIKTARDGQVVWNNRMIDSYLIGAPSVDPVYKIEHWHVKSTNVYTQAGVTGIQVGDQTTKCNFAVLDDCHTKNASSTGLKVSNGNVGQLRGGMFEGSDINVHFTDEAIDTNGWGIYNPRAFGGRVNFWFQGDVNGRYVDDNFITLTSEGHTEHGVILRGRRNNCFIYAESSEVGSYDLLDQSEGSSDNYVVLTGTCNIDPAGSFHGLRQTTSPTYYQEGEKIKGQQVTIDLSSGSRSHQVIGFRNNATLLNTGSAATLFVQKLSERELNNPFYLSLPSTNTGNITVSLDESGYSFTDGSNFRLYKAQGESIFIELQKLDEFTFSINILNSERQPDDTEDVVFSASKSFFFSNYREGNQIITLNNTSGSEKDLLIQEGEVLPVGYSIYFYCDGSSASVDLSIQGGMEFIDGTASKVIQANQVYMVKKISSNSFAAFSAV